jgi:cupin fold WbuC family metalloprotein
MKLSQITPLKNSKSISFKVASCFLHDLDECVSEIIRLSLLDIYSKHNLRFCFHDLGSHNLHQMLIFERRDQYYPPHIHSDRDEMHIVLRGSLEVYLLNSDGSHLSSIVSSASSNSYSSISSGQPHLTRPHTDHVVYLEIKDGPHTSFEQECFQPDADLGSSMSYMKYLSSHLSAF